MARHNNRSQSKQKLVSISDVVEYGLYADSTTEEPRVNKDLLSDYFKSKKKRKHYFVISDDKQIGWSSVNKLEVSTAFRTIKVDRSLGKLQWASFDERRFKSYPDPEISHLIDGSLSMFDRENAAYRYYGYSRYGGDSVRSLYLSRRDLSLWKQYADLGRILLVEEPKDTPQQQVKPKPDSDTMKTVSIDEHAREIELSITQDSKGVLTLEPFICGSSTFPGRISWKDVRYVTEDKLFFCSEFGLIGVVEDHPLLIDMLTDAVDNRVPIGVNKSEIPLLEQHLISEIPDLNKLKFINIPQYTSTKSKESTLRLYLHGVVEDLGQNGSFMASLQVVSSGIEYEFFDKKNYRKKLPEGWIERDFEAENALVEKLVEACPWLNLKQLEQTPYFAADSQQALSAIEKFHEFGWEVLLENLRVNASSKTSISVDSSGIDWFEVNAKVSIGDFDIGIEEIIKASRSRNNYIKLSDKDLVLLPTKWMERLRLMSDIGEVSDGKVRVRQSQLMWLEELLADTEDVSLDQKYSESKEKITKLSGIKPMLPGTGFIGKLRDYQSEGLGWLNFLRDVGFGGCLADDMGLGKTIQVLALLEQHRNLKDGSCGVSLIVAPKSLVDNWILEANKFVPNLKFIAYWGSDRHEILEDLSQYDVLVTTYGSMLRDVKKLVDINFDNIILDEAQAIKNHRSLTAKACRALAATNRLALTGTPIENSMSDLYSIFDFLNPGMTTHLLRASFDSSGSGDASSELALSSGEFIKKGFRPYLLRRTKEEVLSELPSKTEQVIYCEMLVEQRELYDKFKVHYQVSVSKGIKEKGLNRIKMHFFEALLRLRQIACHPGLVENRYSKVASGKMDILIAELEELHAAGQKVLVFSQFTGLLKLIKSRLLKRKIKNFYLDGRTRKRQEVIDQFQDSPDPSVFLISIKAGGVGLNLTSASYCFIVDPWWNPAVESQAIDRIHRIGQHKPVNAYRLITKGSVEERIAQLQEQKKGLVEDFISANDSGFFKSLSAEDIDFIFS